MKLLQYLVGQLEGLVEERGGINFRVSHSGYQLLQLPDIDQ